MLTGFFFLRPWTFTFFMSHVLQFHTIPLQCDGISKIIKHWSNTFFQLDVSWSQIQGQAFVHCTQAQSSGGNTCFCAGGLIDAECLKISTGTPFQTFEKGDSRHKRLLPLRPSLQWMFRWEWFRGIRNFKKCRDLGEIIPGITDNLEKILPIFSKWIRCFYSQCSVSMIPEYEALSHQKE